MAGADLRAALVASCLRGALPPVDFLAVCLVRAMASEAKSRFAKELGDRGVVKIAFEACLYVQRNIKSKTLKGQEFLDTITPLCAL